MGKDYLGALRKTAQIGFNIGRSSARIYVARAFCILFKKMQACYPIQSSRKKSL